MLICWELRLPKEAPPMAAPLPWLKWCKSPSPNREKGEVVLLLNCAKSMAGNNNIPVNKSTRLNSCILINYNVH